MNDTKACSFNLFVGTERDIDNLALELILDGFPRVAVRVMRGSKMQTTKDLFNEVSAALQFPYYFGFNWDALDECVNDLDWMPESAYVLIFTHLDQILAAEKDAEKLFLKVVHDSAQEWAQHQDKTFQVYFQCIPEKQAEVVDRLVAASIDFNYVSGRVAGGRTSAPI
jgi:RNAse (barnase) inhibitor barstar